MKIRIDVGLPPPKKRPVEWAPLPITSIRIRAVDDGTTTSETAMTLNHAGRAVSLSTSWNSLQLLVSRTLSGTGRSNRKYSVYGSRLNEGGMESTPPPLIVQLRDYMCWSWDSVAGFFVLSEDYSAGTWSSRGSHSTGYYACCISAFADVQYFQAPHMYLKVSLFWE